VFRPPHCPGWDEVHNLELRESVAETRREPRGPLEPALALNTPASWQPIRHATRVGEEGEHLVDWSADVVDERVANAPVLVRYMTGTARFVNQIVVGSCGSSTCIGAGDSGSLLVTNDANANPVGLLFAGNNSGSMAIANPIGDVLSYFSVTIDGK